jgi:hypothetical protein
MEYIEASKYLMTKALSDGDGKMLKAIKVVMDERTKSVAIHNCNDNMVGESPNYFCGICGQRL